MTKAVLVLVALALLGLVRAAVGERDRSRGAGVVVAIACFAVAVGATLALERVLARGHPAPWLHAPLGATLAESLVFGGSWGLATRAFARIWPWIGERRILAIANAMPLVIGLALLAAGAAELAWIWLVPAALLAIAPRIGTLATLLPLVLVLAPHQLREAAWNGFLPAGVPLAAWLAILGLPTIAAVGAWARHQHATGPLRTLILSMGCGLAVALGILWLAARSPTCSSAEFIQFHLACEPLPSWP